MAAGTYAALFSGGKDSYLALELAGEQGYSIDRLITIEAPAGSYLYHTPAIHLSQAIAEALGLPHERLELTSAETGVTSSEAAAIIEIEPVRDWIEDQLEPSSSLTGIVSGVVASEYQYELLKEVCDRHDLEFVTPLWGWDGRAVLEAIVARDMSVDVVAVAAGGFDRSWLGRRLDEAAIEELLTMADRFGIHPAGEGGEFETVVVDAPRFSTPITYTADPVWEGSRGHLVVREAQGTHTETTLY